MTYELFYKILEVGLFWTAVWLIGLKTFNIFRKCDILWRIRKNRELVEELSRDHVKRGTINLSPEALAGYVTMSLKASLLLHAIVGVLSLAYIFLYEYSPSLMEHYAELTPVQALVAMGVGVLWILVVDIVRRFVEVFTLYLVVWRAKSAQTAQCFVNVHAEGTWW